MRLLLQRLALIMLPLAVVMLLGTVGYMVVERAPVGDALWMTAISVTTFGIGEAFPLHTGGRILTIVLVFLGIGSIAYGFSSYFTTAGSKLRRRRLMQAIQQLRGHIIVCGFGRVGQDVARALRDADRKVLVVDRSPPHVARATADGFLAIEGDATRDEVVRSLGVERATGLIAATGDDADNLFIVFTARGLSPALDIVARTSDSANADKLRRAGANRVVSPYEAGGRHMANCLLRPNLTEFLDRLTLTSGLELWLEEITLKPSSHAAGSTVAALDLPRLGATLVARLRRGGDTRFAPPPDLALEAGDVLVVLGTREQLGQVQRMADG